MCYSAFSALTSDGHLISIPVQQSLKVFLETFGDWLCFMPCSALCRKATVMLEVAVWLSGNMLVLTSYSTSGPVGSWMGR